MDFLKRWWKQALLLIALPAIPALLVAGQQSSDDRSATDGSVRCRGWEPDNVSCAASKLEQLVATDGIPAALEDLNDQVKRGGVRLSDCHSLTHVVGRAATQRYQNVSAAFRAGSQMCGAGYYHGAMEGIVQELGERRVAQQIPVLCAQLRKDRRDGIRHYSCAHGLGHGLLGISDGVRAALGGCERLRDSNERHYCYSGVFMENTRPHGGTGFRRNVGEQRLRHICPTLEGRPRSVCYQRMPQDEAFAAGTGFQSIIALCETTPGRSRFDCYKGIGALAANHGINKGGEGPARYALTAALCKLGKTHAGSSLCFIGAAATFVYNERSMPGAEAVCMQASPSVRRRCLRVAAERLQRLYGGMAERG